MTEETRIIGSTELTFESGKFASQAHGAAVVTLGETQVLATCVTSKPREGIDFFPLTVDVEERMYAAGKIPGSFFRREGRPSETAILTARLTDRPLRPTFKSGYRDEVQVVATILSADMANPYDIPVINAAGLAVTLAGLPFDGPIAAVRLGLIGGEWRINPTYQDLDLATFDVVVAGRKNDQDGVDILMVEGEAPEETFRLVEEGGTSPTEEIVAEGLDVAKQAIGEIIDFMRDFVAKVGVTPKEWTPNPLYTDEVYAAVDEVAGPRIAGALVTAKAEREANLSALKDEVKAHLQERYGDGFDVVAGQISPAFKDLQKKTMRRKVIAEGVRLDGRKPDEIRQLSAEVGLIPRAHGSALFQRGETQVLNVATLAMLRMNQMIDTLDPTDFKRYIHHYNFPPYSTGETGRVGSPKRREIGHGALAERALVPVVPNEEEFPYTLRLVSDVMSSNGSTSMASVCASTLSMMDAGVPLKAAVAGIAMGLIADGGEYVTLTDILGAEDALGDMDFKVAGTRDMVTAIQLDMKVTGLPQEVLAQALKQAKEARLHILDVMEQTIAGPRDELSTKAPRVIMIQIPVDKIGEVIGPKGKRINEIIAVTGADINIEDDGRVFIGSRDGESAAAAVEMVEAIANPTPILVGERYEGTVVKTTTFGAFVNITPSRDGLVHISKLGRGKRLSAVEDAVKQGDHLTVEVQDIDPQGKISLKPVGEGWDPPEGGWPRPEGEEDRPPRERRDGERPRSGDRDRFRRREGGERRERRD
ncbi:MAG TPA: polyribonucleotide nucleotidyltransferase [Actinobacteria bacterium]|jgi:polyribonucleotide nucleotidyltransferase|nr:polyribonucleotide nucleotidyltransferase [Actinomycetota bacterium]